MNGISEIGTNTRYFIVIGVITLAVFAILCVLVWKLLKIKTPLKVTLIALIAVALTASAIFLTPLKSYFFFEREYLDDIRIELTENEGYIVIKEWTFLQGGGAEIYYENDGKETLIGKTGADDGYCPFDSGQYTIVEEKDKITVSWAFFSSKDDKKDWHSDTFTLTP